MRPHPRGVRWLAMPALLAACVVAACGGDTAATRAKPGRPPSSTAAAQTQAAERSLSGASAGAATPAAMATRTADTEPVSALTIVASDNIYAPAEFRVRAGQEFRVTLENRGMAVHDWRVRGVPDAEGKDTGTRLLAPGQSETTALTLDRAGEYAFYCEVHPVEMRGTLRVQ